MIRSSDMSKCSGCGACRDCCPMKAIKMLPDEVGFLYPQIDKEKCIECNKCRNICPVIQPVKVDKNATNNIVAYAAKSKDDEIRELSSSGGIFTEIAKHIIKHNGVVFGAAFDEDTFKVKHIGIERMEDIKKLRGSKYIQSETGSSYLKAKDFLEEGRPVFFTGTPCQIGGLYSFLKKDYENLYTQDIICHGVPSPMVWEKYIHYREKKAATKTRKISFRYKKDGWKRFFVKFEFTNGTEYLSPHSEDLFMRSFLWDLCLRRSCYQCEFKQKKRMSDITLADFWGIEKALPEMDDDRGISLAIVNSSKALQLIFEIKEEVDFCEVDFEEAIKYNPAMITSVKPNPRREEFLKCVEEYGFEGAEKKYLRIPIRKRMIRVIKEIVKQVLQK